MEEEKMIKRFLSVLMFGLLCFALPVVWAQDTPLAASATGAVEPGNSEPAKGGDAIANADAMLEKALVAYNKQDPKAFYADFAQSMAAIATEQAFQALYVGMYMKDFGQYKSRELLKDKCVVPADSTVGLLQYKAVFEKNEKMTIAVNIVKEGDAWKLMQVQFNKEQ